MWKKNSSRMQLFRGIPYGDILMGTQFSVTQPIKRVAFSRDERI